MTSIGTRLGKLKVFSLVRDSQGRPKIADPTKIPEPIWNALTDEDFEWLRSEGHNPQKVELKDLLLAQEAKEKSQS